MYKLYPDYNGQKVQCIKRIQDNACIPFDPANIDYAKFKKELVDGVELQDETGNVMTREQVLEFFHTLP